MSSLNQHQQDSPVDPDPAEEKVTVLDPHHPLFGCTFILAKVVGEDERGKMCVVRLPGGTERFIPLEATDRALNPVKTYSHPLSLPAVTRLLEVYERIKSRSNEAMELPYPSEPEEVSPETQGAGEREGKEQLTEANSLESIEGDMLPIYGASPDVPGVGDAGRRVQGAPTQSSESRQQPEKPGAHKLIRLGDVSRYLDISHGLVKKFVETGLIKTRTNPLDHRMKLVSTQELDEFKQWLREMENQRDEAKAGV